MDMKMTTWQNFKKKIKRAQNKKATLKSDTILKE